MGSVFDVLPNIENQIQDKTAELLMADEGKFYDWEALIVLPAINLFVHYLDGINRALQAGNYIVAMSCLRGLMESLAIVIYEGTIKLPENGRKEFMDRFRNNGRLYRFDEQKQKWRKLQYSELIKHLESICSIKIMHAYNHACEMLHFSNKHLSLLAADKTKQQTDSKHTVTISITSEDSIPNAKIKETIETASKLGKILIHHTDGLVREKQGFAAKRNAES